MKIRLTISFRHGLLARLRQAWHLIVHSEIRLEPNEVAKLREWLDFAQVQADVERLLTGGEPHAHR